MQLSPRLTGASGSPWVATTRPSCTPTSTEQPVPQKRHGALSQRTCKGAAPAWASAALGRLSPAVAAAAATAWVLMNSRRFNDMVELSVPDDGGSGRDPRRAARGGATQARGPHRGAALRWPAGGWPVLVAAVFVCQRGRQNLRNLMGGQNRVRRAMRRAIFDGDDELAGGGIPCLQLQAGDGGQRRTRVGQAGRGDAKHQTDDSHAGSGTSALTGQAGRH